MKWGEKIFLLGRKNSGHIAVPSRSLSGTPTCQSKSFRDSTGNPVQSRKLCRSKMGLLLRSMSRFKRGERECSEGQSCVRSPRSVSMSKCCIFARSAETRPIYYFSKKNNVFSIRSNQRKRNFHSNCII